MLIGGPSPTKEEFEAGNFLHHEIQKRIIGIFDVAYTNEDGLSELVDAAKDALKGMGVVKEKALMDKFLRELVKDASNAAYGEESIRKNLELGAVDTLLLSANLRKSRLRINARTVISPMRKQFTLMQENRSGISPSVHVRNVRHRSYSKKRST